MTASSYLSVKQTTSPSSIFLSNLEQAKQRNPSRWGTRSVRNCEAVGAVTLNPEKEIEMKQAA